ncbi:MAG: DUF4442 domain-containing protein [Bacteriovoracaceae bacterium]|jgi:acyl-coenzyme A thioesterase PaaI-like protein|nr:hypothetical protein [Halobacteriovoraceae bacterium]MDP7319549.1 DUF4442 domain-containing protein [Bacteriovoracaceae bacterium]
MNKKISEFVDSLLSNSNKKLVLKTLEKLFNSGIPFNLPHKFKFIELSQQQTIIELPFIKKNKNHLGGQHACAIATLGEYPAGLSIIKFFGSSSYRIILKELHTHYFQQGRGKLQGRVDVQKYNFKEFKEQLDSHTSVDITLTTEIYNTDQEVIAEVTTTWQLKPWTKVTFKHNN